MFPLVPFTNLGEVSFFALVLGRLAGIFSAIPLIGGERVPMRIRVITILIMTLVIFPLLRQHPPQLPSDVASLVVLVMRETLIGISLGLLAKAILAAVEFCGQLIGTQMGLSMANLFDPSLGQISLMSTFQMLLASLLFLSLEVHHLFIRAIVESYTVLPPGSWQMSEGLIRFLVETVGNLFILGIKLAAPVMVALLATSVALGIMARTFPQMNIFMVSLPLKLGVGFLMLGLSLLVFLRILGTSFAGLNLQINTLYRLLAQG